MIFFETRRLIFRRFELEDLEALGVILADKAVCRYVGDGDPLSLEKTREWIHHSRENVARFGYGSGALVSKETSALMGW